MADVDLQIDTESTNTNDILWSPFTLSQSQNFRLFVYYPGMQYILRLATMKARVEIYYRYIPFLDVVEYDMSRTHWQDRLQIQLQKCNG